MEEQSENAKELWRQAMMCGLRAILYASALNTNPNGKYFLPVTLECTSKEIAVKTVEQVGESISDIAIGMIDMYALVASLPAYDKKRLQYKILGDLTGNAIFDSDETEGD